jgi:hypothetical protein
LYFEPFLLLKLSFFFLPVCEHTPGGFMLSQNIERKVMKREPSGRSRLRLFSKAPLAEVLKEEGEEPLGKDRLGLPVVAAQEAAVSSVCIAFPYRISQSHET